MKPYPKYKDSGIQWIEQIPEGWGVLRFKHCFNTSTGMNIAKSDLSDSGVAVISYGQIHAKTNTRTHLSDDLLRYIPLELVKGGNACKLQKNDVVFADTSEDLEGCGNAVFIDTDKEIFAGYHTIIARPTIKGEIKYLAYLFNTPLWRRQIREAVAGIKVYSITQRLLNDSKILLPPLPEQQAIVAYLDDKTSKLDECVLLLELQKADLTDYRKAIIFEKVTRGMRLDTNLKDSGVQWIGKIPETWELIPCKSLFQNLDYLRKPITANQRSRNNPRYYYYGASGVIDKIDFYNVDDKVLLIGEDGANLIMRNLPLIYKAEGKIWVNNHAHILKPIKDNYDYLAYVMECADYSEFITGSAQPKLSQANLNNVKLPIPPIQEQHSIAVYLNEKTAKIDEAIKRIDEQINDLCAYRTALISDVVTGKIDVRNN